METGVTLIQGQACQRMGIDSMGVCIQCCLSSTITGTNGEMADRTLAVATSYVVPSSFWNSSCAAPCHWSCCPVCFQLTAGVPLSGLAVASSCFRRRRGGSCPWFTVSPSGTARSDCQIKLANFVMLAHRKMIFFVILVFVQQSRGAKFRGRSSRHQRASWTCAPGHGCG